MEDTIHLFVKSLHITFQRYVTSGHNKMNCATELHCLKLKGDDGQRVMDNRIQKAIESFIMDLAGADAAVTAVRKTGEFSVKGGTPPGILASAQRLVLFFILFVEDKNLISL
jgi:hypothetical protein